MSYQLNRFAVKLVLLGLSEEQHLTVLADLQEEFNMRPYVQNLQMSWEPSTNSLLVQSTEEASNHEQAASLLSDNLHDAVSAVVNQPSRLRIEVVDVSKME